VEIAAHAASARSAARGRATVTASRQGRLRPAQIDTAPARRGKPCGLRRGAAICLTHPARSLHSANDSGGRSRERSRGRQTGNSGANPGRPRRCDQATRSAASSHCEHRRRRCREKACGRRSLGVRRPTRCHGFAGPRGRDGGHGRSRPSACSIRPHRNATLRAGRPPRGGGRAWCRAAWSHQVPCAAPVEA
jgi:hypothetical protein